MTNISSLIYAIFRKSIDDGSELIVISKPITRTAIIWAKIILYLLITIIVAGITALISYLTKFTNYSNEIVATELAKNTFIATILIYLIFGGIASILSIFMKQVGSLICLLTIFILLMIYSIITNQIFMSVPKSLKYKQGLYLSPISLVQTDTKNDLSKTNYHWGANASINSSNNFMTLDFYNKQNFGISPNEYLRYSYNQSINSNNFYVYLWSNVLYQLTSIYTWPSDDYLESSYYNLSTVLRSSNSYNICLDFDTNTLNNESNNFVKINYLLQDYYLGNNYTSYVSDTKNNLVFLSDSYISSMSGSINETNNYVLPAIDIDNNLILNYEINWSNLEEFVEKYFNSNFINLVKQSNTSILNFWFSVFLSQNLETIIGTNNELSNLNYLTKNSIIKKSLYQLDLFQKLSANALLNNVSKDTTINEYLFSCLFDFRLPQTSSNQQLQISQSNVALFYPISNWNNLNGNYNEYLLNYQPLYYLINANEIPTFNFVNVSTFFNYYVLLSVWSTLGLLSFSIGSLLFFRFNFS
ncbi:MAG: ABC transporter permease subunit [Ureaplasma sp.]|nr:ABC transporter permease subunit [Ureaplasma sp.]